MILLFLLVFFFSLFFLVRVGGTLCQQSGKVKLDLWGFKTLAKYNEWV
jgi:hypothetical protein